MRELQGERGTQPGGTGTIKNVESTNRAPIWFLWGLAAVILFLDWITKKWALEVLQHSESQEVIGEFLRFTFTRNTGVAFGLLADRKLPLEWLSVIALIVVLWLALRPGGRRWPRTFALGLILGGAIGNLVDRVRWGWVVDFIDVGIGTLRWPVFNIADSAITVGGVIWSLQLLFSRPAPKPVSSPDSFPQEQVAKDVGSP